MLHRVVHCGNQLTKDGNLNVCVATCIHVSLCDIFHYKLWLVVDAMSIKVNQPLSACLMNTAFLLVLSPPLKEEEIRHNQNVPQIQSGRQQESVSATAGSEEELGENQREHQEAPGASVLEDAQTKEEEWQEPTKSIDSDEQMDS
jgi:hypothetical protein